MAPAARWLLPQSRPRRASTRWRSALGIGRSGRRACSTAAVSSDAGAARRFLNPSLDDLHDPLLLRGMDCALERLTRAIRDREKILIYGDYDVDGTTSVVILKTAIELAGGTAGFPRARPPQGRLRHARRKWWRRPRREACRLIVSVDTGIRAAEVVRRAQRAGRSTSSSPIITCPKPNCRRRSRCSIPNRPDCAYPEKNLCGVGVAFKLVQGLLADAGLAARTSCAACSESFLKLVAIGTVADVVPLTGENRIIVKHGLSGLARGAQSGVARAAGRGRIHRRQRSIGHAGGVSHRAAHERRRPHGDRQRRHRDVADGQDVDRARALAAQLHALNTERQKTEADIVEAILDECARMPVEDTQAALVFCARDWHRGVLGIVASRLVERFHRPVFVLSEDAKRAWRRAPGAAFTQFHLLEALESMPELFVKFGGHCHAAGLDDALRIDVDEFRAAVSGLRRARLTPEDFRRGARNRRRSISLREINERSVAEISSPGAVRLRQCRARICRAGCRGGWAAGRLEGKAPARAAPAGRPQAVAQGLELRRAHRRTSARRTGGRGFRARGRLVLGRERATGLERGAARRAPVGSRRMRLRSIIKAILLPSPLLAGARPPHRPSK